MIWMLLLEVLVGLDLQVFRVKFGGVPKSNLWCVGVDECLNGTTCRKLVRKYCYLDF